MRHKASPRSSVTSSYFARPAQRSETPQGGPGLSPSVASSGAASEPHRNSPGVLSPSRRVCKHLASALGLGGTTTHRRGSRMTCLDPAARERSTGPKPRRRGSLAARTASPRLAGLSLAHRRSCVGRSPAMIEACRRIRQARACTVGAPHQGAASGRAHATANELRVTRWRTRALARACRAPPRSVAPRISPNALVGAGGGDQGVGTARNEAAPGLQLG